jgi:hypothetical protein
MIRVDEEWLERVETLHPGIGRSIAYYEGLDVPPCPKCASADTASVSAGIVGRSIHVACATSKMRLVPNGHPADYYCNSCGRYFDAPAPSSGSQRRGRMLEVLDPRTTTDENLEAFVQAVLGQIDSGEREE